MFSLVSRDEENFQRGRVSRSVIIPLTDCQVVCQSAAIPAGLISKGDKRFFRHPHPHIYAHTRTHTHTHEHTHTSTHTRTHTYTHTHARIHTYARAHTHTHHTPDKHTYTLTHIDARANVHVFYQSSKLLFLKSKRAETRPFARKLVIIQIKDKHERKLFVQKFQRNFHCQCGYNTPFQV